MRSQGIVLKNWFPKKHKMVLFDETLGAIEVAVGMIANKERYCGGSLLEYSLEKQQFMYKLDSLDILDVPLLWARHDILFLHHVLELSLYFLPLNSLNDGIFSLLCFLYQSKANEPFSDLFKKIFLMKFFVILGMYPDDELTQGEFFPCVIKEPIDVIVNQGIDLRTEQSIDRWLLHCLYMHPKAHLFRTVHFLTKSRGILQSESIDLGGDG